MDTAIEGAPTLAITVEAALEATCALVIEAELWDTVSTAHRLGVLATVAARVHLDGARLALAWMTGVLACMAAAVQLLAANTTARGAALMESRETRLLGCCLRAAHGDGLGTAEAFLRDGDSTRRTGTWMTRIGAAVSAFAAAASLATAMWIGTAAARRVLHAAAPAPVDLGDVFSCILASWTSPSTASVANLWIFLHSIVLFGLLDAAVGPLAHAWQVQHRVAL